MVFRKQGKWLGMLAASVMLLACTPEQAKHIQNSFADKPKISFYPYLFTKQFDFLNKQNIIGLAPGALIIPQHEDNDLELQMNANSWWGIWPHEVIFSNYFIAEQAKRILGCGPLGAGTSFTIPKGVYTLKRQKVIIGHDLTWKLKYNLSSICETATKLPLGYYKDASLYWDIPFAQNRIYP